MIERERRPDGLLRMSICLDVRRELGSSKEFFGSATVFDKVHQEGDRSRWRGWTNLLMPWLIPDAVRNIGYEEVMMALIDGVVEGQRGNDQACF